MCVIKLECVNEMIIIHTHLSVVTSSESAAIKEKKMIILLDDIGGVRNIN